MSIIDRFFIGKVIKDFGTLDESFLGIGKIKHSTLLVERYGRFYLVIKSSAWALFSGSVSYEKIPLDDALKIQEYITESQQIAKNFPKLPYDISKLALRYSLITMAIASAINLIATNSGVIFLTTFVAVFFFHSNQFIEFWNHPDVDSRTKKFLIVIPLITFLIAISKFCWLTLVIKN